MSPQPMLPTDKTVRFDCSVNNESITYIILPFAQIPNRDFFFCRDDTTTANTVTVQTASPTDVFLDGSTSFTMKVGDSPRHVVVPNGGKALVFVGSSGSTSSGSSAAGAGGSSAPTTQLVTPFSSFTATGFIDPNSGAVTLSINAADPDSTVLGCDLYAEIPDISGTPALVLGEAPIGAQATIAGQWVPIPLGKQSFTSPLPWTVTFPSPYSVDPTQNVTMRLYATEFTATAENPLVEANQANPSTNTVVVVDSLDSGSPTAGTNITSVSGPIVASVLENDDSTGKLLTPVLVDVSSVPTNIPGWCYQLVLTVGGADPTQQANQRVVTGLFSTAGPVPSGTDGISTPHSFTIPTPTAVTNAIVWLQSGLPNASGAFQGNNIVPGITPHFPISYGSTTGVLDASQAILASINSSMAVTSGLFGVASNGIATFNLQNGAVTTPIIANLAVTQAQIANLAVGAAQIILATITGAQIANATIASANIALATIVQANMANASIGTAQIQSLAVTDAQIANVSAGKITTGTITATISMTAPVLTITGSPFTINLDSTNGFKCTGNGITTTITNGTIGGAAAGLFVNDGGTFGCAHYSNGISVGTYTGATAYASLSAVTQIGPVNCGQLLLTNSAGTYSFELAAFNMTASSAGSIVGYVNVKINGSSQKMAYYAP